MKSERQLFLKLCVPGSGVLSKCEKDHIEVLRKHDVTYLKLLGAVEAAQKRVINLQKEFDDCFPSRSSVEQESLTVDETNDENYYEDEDEMVDDPVIL